MKALRCRSRPAKDRTDRVVVHVQRLGVEVKICSDLYGRVVRSNDANAVGDASNGIRQRAGVDPVTDGIDFVDWHGPETGRHARLRTTGDGVSEQFQVKRAVHGIARFYAQQARVAISRSCVD